ncbi:hypothetical protein BDK51DRAFT_53188 [Blyttiomyces helicus]|uniref:Uncharacterized protein n=1 Tax=Blyttiomyces helicus TaxID=388810 RepID=A0A4P9W4E5_9FUNG|nr:hypothetical protein BDK51DRAFT_53188 [Blyttiomyces helicus]|eukprot:RKO87221.1 hypothetical protein BDK51DRAFT_53188 [Blyttiomyces helicus]
MPLHKHVPLIKFLGPRSLLPAHKPAAAAAAAPAAAPVVRTAPGRFEYSSRSEMPKRFWAKEFRPVEIDAIDSGGADVILTGA